MKIHIISQARMTSTRLPGKVLKTVMGKTLLEYQIERLRRSRLATNVIVATTKNREDDPIAELCKSLGVDIFRGSEQDVLSRYFLTAKEYQSDIVVRVTSDCPLIDPAVVDSVIRIFLDSQPCDYASNLTLYPRGMDAEVFSFRALSKAESEFHQPNEREHVTVPFYSNPEMFRAYHLPLAENLRSRRWTVDTLEDFELIKLLLESLYPANPVFSMGDILAKLKENPDWENINREVKQKPVF